MSMFQKINKAFDRLLSVTDVIASCLLVMIVVFILLQIFFRTFNFNIQWTEAASRYSFIGMVFFGSVSAVRHGAHIAITTLVDLLPLSVRRWVDMLVYLMTMLMSGILTYSSLILSRSAQGVASSAIRWFQMNYLYVPVGILCVLMFAAALLRIIELMVDKDILARESRAAAEEEAESIRKLEEEYETEKLKGQGGEQI